MSVWKLFKWCFSWARDRISEVIKIKLRLKWSLCIIRRWKWNFLRMMLLQTVVRRWFVYFLCFCHQYLDSIYSGKDVFIICVVGAIGKERCIESVSLIKSFFQRFPMKSIGFPSSWYLSGSFFSCVVLSNYVDMRSNVFSIDIWCGGLAAGTPYI